MDWRWTYCWWNKSRTTWYGKCPMIYRVLHVSIGVGFLSINSMAWSRFFFEVLFRGQGEVSAGQKLLSHQVVSWNIPFAHSVALDGYIDLSVKWGGAPCGTSCQQITLCNRWVSGECINPHRQKNSTQKQPCSLCSHFSLSISQAPAVHHLY